MICYHMLMFILSLNLQQVVICVFLLLCVLFLKIHVHVLLSFYSQGWYNGSVHFAGSISLAIRQLACRLFQTASKFSSSTNGSYFALLVKLC